MAQYIKTRVRCEIFPSKVGENFKTRLQGQTPKIYKGAGVDFELAFFNADEDLYDVSNISSLSLLVKPQGNPAGAPEILKTIDATAINQGLTLQQWKAGTAAHAVVTLTDDETRIGAGAHALTIYGLTQDDALDTDVFGVSQLEVIDAGITDITNPTLEPNYATLEQIAAMLAGYVTYVVPPGKLLTFTTQDQLHRRILGIGNGPVRIDDLEEV